jgi:hypothetical protein
LAELDLSADERIELSFSSPNLLCVLEREPPAEVEETRLRAREEAAHLLRELWRLRPISVRTSAKDRHRLTLELSRVEATRLFEEIGDLLKPYTGPRLRMLYTQLESWLGLWDEDNYDRKRRRR